jgi:hypothetical protein
VEIRLGVVALLALALQLLAIMGPLGSDDLPRRILFVGSYLFLGAFVAANLRRPGIVLIGVGALMNFAAIVANSGLMPVTPETLARTGYEVEGLRLGEWVSGTKNVVLAREDVNLWFFTDRLVWESQRVVRAFSVGDVVIAMGLVVMVAELLLPRVRR